MGGDSSLPLTELTAISPIDGRYGGKVAALRDSFSEYGYIHARVQVEVAWLHVLSEMEEVPEVPRFSEDARRFLDSLMSEFDAAAAAEVKKIEAVTNHDVKAVEYYVKDRLREHAELAPAVEFVHFACTSEDINNVSHALMVEAAVRGPIRAEAFALLEDLCALAEAHADLPMLSMTHGQPATPTTFGKEAANFAHRLSRQLRQLLDTRPMCKLNGAVGSYNAHVVAYPAADWEKAARGVADRLGLAHSPYTTQIEPHDWIAESAMALARWNTVLLDMSRDMWLYVSRRLLSQRVVAGEVGSSTMPHKINPIDFENAEGNVGLANATLLHLAGKLPVSRMQRDLSDSSALRALGTGFAHALLAAKAARRGLGRVHPDAGAMARELDENWEVLAEPVQTVMRRRGLDAPYEQLKALTRGKRVDAAAMRAFVASLEGLPTDDVARLSALTPASYTGHAGSLARRVRAVVTEELKDHGFSGKQ